MKKRGLNIYQFTFCAGLLVFVVSVGEVFVNQKINWLNFGEEEKNVESIVAQIRQQRVGAINNAVAGNKITYEFESPGDGFLALPMEPNKEEKGIGENK